MARVVKSVLLRRLILGAYDPRSKIAQSVLSGLKEFRQNSGMAVAGYDSVKYARSCTPPSPAADLCR